MIWKGVLLSKFVLVSVNTFQNCITFAYSIKLMKTLQRIGILCMLLVFLFGTFGLSVLNHSCNSSNET